MIIEKATKKIKNSFLNNIYAFRIDFGTGFVSVDNEYIVLWYDRENFPTVYSLKNIEELNLKNMLITLNIIDENDDVLSTYGEEAYEVVFREL